MQAATAASELSAAPRGTRAAGSAARLSFDGTNDLVSVADANALDLTNGMTLSAWLRPTTLSGWRTAILKEAPSGLSMRSTRTTTHRVPPATSTSAVDRSALGTAALALNTWTHLATTYDGTTLRVFVNGAQVGDAWRFQAR